MDCKYIIDKSQLNKIIIKTEKDDIEINILEGDEIIDCCITRIEQILNTDDGDVVNKYIQFFDINGMSSQIMINDNDIDEQNPIKTGELKCDTDYLFIKIKHINDELVPIYVDLNKCN